MNNKINLIGQDGLMLVEKVASHNGVEKRECRGLGHMERKGYKKGEKEEKKGGMQKIWERKKRENLWNPLNLREKLQILDWELS